MEKRQEGRLGHAKDGVGLQFWIGHSRKNSLRRGHFSTNLKKVRGRAVWLTGPPCCTDPGLEGSLVRGQSRMEAKGTGQWGSRLAGGGPGGPQEDTATQRGLKATRPGESARQWVWTEKEGHPKTGPGMSNIWGNGNVKIQQAPETAQPGAGRHQEGVAPREPREGIISMKQSWQLPVSTPNRWVTWGLLTHLDHSHFSDTKAWLMWISG